jgi:glycosyltransferase involved in cell wall biosynthesis
MRILHVIHRLDREAGGTSALAVSMCEALAARGHHVSLFSLDRATPNGTTLPAKPNFNARLFASGPLTFSPALSRALRAEIPTYDLVHIHMLYRLPQALAARFAYRAHVPYCMQPHGALEPVLFHKLERRRVKRVYEFLVEKNNLRRASGLIFTTTGERDATEFLGLSNPAYIVPAGLAVDLYRRKADTNGFRARHGLAGKDILLWMGRMTQVKALPVLMQAFLALAARHPSLALVIAGPDQDDEIPLLEKTAREAGLQDRVVFTGMIHDDEKLAALQTAQLFVLPSYTENFGISAMEAMAAGCPAIVSENVKIAPEIVSCGAGLSAPVDAGKLAAAIESVLRDPTRRAQMAAAASQLAQQYDWAQIAERLEQAYQAMTSAPKPAS